MCTAIAGAQLDGPLFAHPCIICRPASVTSKPHIVLYVRNVCNTLQPEIHTRGPAGSPDQYIQSVPCQPAIYNITLSRFAKDAILHERGGAYASLAGEAQRPHPSPHAKRMSCKPDSSYVAHGAACRTPLTITAHQLIQNALQGSQLRSTLAAAKPPPNRLMML